MQRNLRALFLPLAAIFVAPAVTWTLSNGCVKAWGRPGLFYCSDSIARGWNVEPEAATGQLKLPSRLSDSVCVTLDEPANHNNSILILGGCNAATEDVAGACTSISRRGYLFNPRANSFRALAQMPHRRYRFAAVSDGELVYIFGGRNMHDVLICAVDYLNVTSGKWGTIPGASWDNGYCASDLGAWKGADGFIYLVGGYNGGYTTSYGRVNLVKITKDKHGKPTGATFTLDKTSMKQARGDITCLRAPSTTASSSTTTTTSSSQHDAVYCFGGFTSPDKSPTNAWQPLKSVEKYSNGAWSSVAPMKRAKGDYAAAYLNGRFVLIGGGTKYGPVKDVSFYSVEKDAWTEAGDFLDLPAARFRFGAAAVPSTSSSSSSSRENGRIFTFGGQGNVTRAVSNSGSFYYQLSDQVLVYSELSMTIGGTCS